MRNLVFFLFQTKSDIFIHLNLSIANQGMLKYGKDSIRSRAQPLKEICRDLHCQRDRYTWTSHPALEGTSCAESKVKKQYLSHFGEILFSS